MPFSVSVLHSLESTITMFIHSRPYAMLTIQQTSLSVGSKQTFAYKKKLNQLTSVFLVDVSNRENMGEIGS